MAGIVILASYLMGVTIPYYLGKAFIYVLPYFYELSDPESFASKAPFINGVVALAIGAITLEVFLTEFPSNEKFDFKRMFKIFGITFIIWLLIFKFSF